MSSPQTAVRRSADWPLALFLLAALLAWDATGLDLAVVRLVGHADGFPLRDHWLTAGVMHEGGRLLGWFVLVALVVNVWRPWTPKLTRAERWRWVAVTLLCVIAVPALKRISTTSCPWDLAEFGGLAAHVSHWRLGHADGGPGHCFPSGHAASAFGFLWGWFALRHHDRRLARAWLAGVLLLGTLYGLAQLLRGAHYPSHTFWTAWLCWAICVVVDAAVRRQRERGVARAPGAGTRPVGEDAT